MSSPNSTLYHDLYLLQTLYRLSFVYKQLNRVAERMESVFAALSSSLPCNHACPPSFVLTILPHMMDTEDPMNGAGGTVLVAPFPPSPPSPPTI